MTLDWTLAKEVLTVRIRCPLALSSWELARTAQSLEEVVPLAFHLLETCPDRGVVPGGGLIGLVVSCLT